MYTPVINYWYSSADKQSYCIVRTYPSCSPHGVDMATTHCCLYMHPHAYPYPSLPCSNMSLYHTDRQIAIGQKKELAPCSSHPKSVAPKWLSCWDVNLLPSYHWYVSKNWTPSFPHERITYLLVNPTFWHKPVCVSAMFHLLFVIL